MIIGILKGVAYIILSNMIVSFFSPNKNPRFAMRHSLISMIGFFGGIALLPVASLAFLPLWFMFLCYGVLIYVHLGTDPNASPLQQSAFERQHGMTFNTIGMVCYIIAAALFVYQTFIA